MSVGAALFQEPRVCINIRAELDDIAADHKLQPHEIVSIAHEKAESARARRRWSSIRPFTASVPPLLDRLVST